MSLKVLILNQIIYLQWVGLSLKEVFFSKCNFCQQKYIYDLFIEEETTGKKAAPKKVAFEIKNLRIA